MSELRTELATTKLRNINISTQINDLGYDFFYKRITNPNEDRTDAFNLFYKDHTSERWLTYRGVLTDSYIIVKTEEVLKQIQKNLNATITNQKFYRHMTSIKCIFVLNDFEINVDPDSDVDKLMFKLITNISADVDVLSKGRLSFNIINGFSGNHTLQLNYGIMKEISHQNRSIQLNNIFILDNFNKKLIHDSRMILQYEEIINIQNHVQERINIFKQVKVTNEFIDEFKSKFGKKIVKKFMSLYNSFDDNFKNFYYCSFVWSAILESEKKIYEEIRLRSLVTKYINNVTAQSRR